MSLKTTTITTIINGGEDKTLGAASATASFPGVNPLYNGQITLANGTGSGNAQKIGIGGFSLTGGASVTFDLTAFPGPYGNVNFSLVKHFQIDNPSTDATNLLKAGDDGTVSNPWTGPFSGSSARVNVHPVGTTGGPMVIPSPLVGFLVDGTHKALKIANSGAGTNAANGNVILIGEGT